MSLFIDPQTPILPAAADTQKWTTERVLEVRYWTPTLLSFRTSRDEGFRFAPGEYARLGLTTDGGIVWRPFSMVSAIADDSLEFLAVLVPGGAFSGPLERLRVGDAIDVERSSFGFLTTAQLATGRQLWMLATGTGIGPFVSIVRDAAVWLAFERLIVVHSVRRSAELAYREELDALAADDTSARGRARMIYLPVVTREAGATALSKRIPELLADGHLEEAAGTPLRVEASRLMICGNPSMALTLRQLLSKRGFATGRRGVTGQMAFEKYW
ncbi:ferredoxin--NADP reductase [Candidatus Accumulibacter sp. ACC007]|uniref:ferredoxin--NADP reductase n=1 Tax=Candidatus Accumulibacter sp. ACC007 TaxID=2823333 RepID=UPI0025C55B65|nr:ferredoxin--NADP reductase [Candidatus Accumulibacter sp. ACC007]